jgi:hypothetical protein
MEREKNQNKNQKYTGKSASLKRHKSLRPIAELEWLNGAKITPHSNQTRHSQCREGIDPSRSRNIKMHRRATGKNGDEQPIAS